MEKSRVNWFCSFLKLQSNFRRCSLLKQSLLVTILCVINLLFVISQVGLSYGLGHRRTDEDNKRRTGGFYSLDLNGSLPDNPGFQTGSGLVVPTRSNVVYITLKSKRVKSANIRGTVRPKLRKKLRRKTTNLSVTQSKPDLRHAGQINAPEKETPRVNYKILNIHTRYDDGTDSQISSIRIYNQQAPPWFSAQDVETMRFLADVKVLRIKEISLGDAPSFLIFEGEAAVPPANLKHLEINNVCGGQCGIIHSPLDNMEVFAFHLDRVLGFNKTLPAVSRKFSFLHDGQSSPVVLWDASKYPEDLAAGPVAVRLTWREYQNSLTQRCWHKNIKPKPDSNCSTIHHYEWSRLALFDFLLQIHNRLDQSCCGFRPRREDVCAEVDQRTSCKDQDNIKLANIIHRNQDPRHLLFTNNKGFFDRNEDNLDFRLLEGIKEFPEQAVSVLKGSKLRERLLQSLFLDQTYWESQGGRRGINKLISIIERRAKILLTFINAHGIKVVTMNN